MRVLNIKETRKTRGGLYPGGGGLITGCILLFTGRIGPITGGGLISRGAYKRQFIYLASFSHQLGSSAPVSMRAMTANTR